jgi:hypothetical protein
MPGGAATSRFRFGRAFHCVVKMSESTSKCRRKVCQAKSGPSGDLFCVEQHIIWSETPTAAIGCVYVPVGDADVCAGEVAKRTGDAVD